MDGLKYAPGNRSLVILMDGGTNEVAVSVAFVVSHSVAHSLSLAEWNWHCLTNAFRNEAITLDMVSIDRSCLVIVMSSSNNSIQFNEWVFSPQGTLCHVHHGWRWGKVRCSKSYDASNLASVDLWCILIFTSKANRGPNRKESDKERNEVMSR